jgi:MFS family permease
MNQSADITGRSMASTLGRALASLTAAGAVTVITLTLTGFAARWWWRFEQVCHFRVQYFWLLVIAGLILWLARRRPLAGLSLFAALLNAKRLTQAVSPAKIHKSNEFSKNSCERNSHFSSRTTFESSGAQRRGARGAGCSCRNAVLRFISRW